MVNWRWGVIEGGSVLRLVCELRSRTHGVALAWLMLERTGAFFELVALIAKFARPLCSVVDSRPLGLHQAATTVFEETLSLCQFSASSTEPAFDLSDGFIKFRAGWLRRSRCVFVVEFAGVFECALISELALVVGEGAIETGFEVFACSFEPAGSLALHYN